MAETVRAAHEAADLAAREAMKHTMNALALNRSSGSIDRATYGQDIELEAMPKQRIGYTWTSQQIAKAQEAFETVINGSSLDKYGQQIMRELLSGWISELQHNGREILESLGRPWRTESYRKREDYLVSARKSALEAADRGEIEKLFFYIGQEYLSVIARFRHAGGISTIRKYADPTFCNFVWGKVTIWDKFWRGGTPKDVEYRGYLLELFYSRRVGFP